MPRSKKTWFAVLGLLAWRPMSGYDIKKLVEIGLSHFWSESYGALYPTLAQLVSAGLVSRRSDRGRGKRPRHVFSITPRGRGELERWLRGPTEEPRVRNEVVLKLFLSPSRPWAESVRLLEEHRTRQLASHEDFAASEVVLRRALKEGVLPVELQSVLGDGPKANQPSGARSRQLLVLLLSLRQGVLAAQARLAWCDEALRAVRQEARATNPRLRGVAR